jgi:hypothetical protein
MRIALSDLQARIDYLNEKTGSPKTPWTKNEAGRNEANIDNYHLSQAYGGCCLHRMSTKGGGVHDVFSCGHVPKRELYTRLNSFILGIDAQD